MLKGLYIVVRHRKNPDQTFVNSWIDDDRIEAITTTIDIGQFCDETKKGNERVYVHRCGWENEIPTICCSVKVTRVDLIDKRTKLVNFTDQIVLKVTPPVIPNPGQSFYFA